MKRNGRGGLPAPTMRSGTTSPPSSIITIVSSAFPAIVITFTIVAPSYRSMTTTTEITTIHHIKYSLKGRRCGGRMNVDRSGL